MARQHVEYKVPGTDKDSGEEDLTAIKPVADGEPAQEAVFKRPTENLRTRTEFIRDELENLKYLSDADRSLLLSGAGNITWAGLPTGTFISSANMVIKPFIAPVASTASRLIIGANTASQITIRTRQDGALGQPRAYNGANTISFDFTPLIDNPILITVDGAPANNFHVRYDNNVATGTTNAQLIAALQANVAFTTTWGLEAVMEGNGVPPEVGFPTPPAPVGSNKVIISGPEQATRFMAGAAEAEQHIITPGHITNFFADTLNQLIEGDVIAVQYDELVMSPTFGGRRQSLNEAAENFAALVAGANLFLVRRFPSRVPLALPLAAVSNGSLIFINGRSFNLGETGPLVAAGASYQGSAAPPNSWADNTGVAVGGPAISFEVALDTIIQTLGSKTAASGAEKVGIQAIAGSPYSVSAGGVHAAISSVLSGANTTQGNLNTHVANPTGAHASTAISFNTAGRVNIAVGSVNAQLAMNDLDAAIGAVPGSILNTVNTFTKANTFDMSTGAANTSAVTATGKGNAAGLVGLGGNLLDPPGIYGVGGTHAGPGFGGGAGVKGQGFQSGAGIEGFGGASFSGIGGGIGVFGAGASASTGNPGGVFQGGAGGGGFGSDFDGGPGVTGLGGNKAGIGTSGSGGVFTGGTVNGDGARGFGVGTGDGLIGLGSGAVGILANAVGVSGWGGTQNGSLGLKGIGGPTNGGGVYGEGHQAGRGVHGLCTDTGAGVWGFSSGGEGVHGESDGGPGVIGKTTSATQDGVVGVGASGVYTPLGKAGVVGVGGAANGAGVVGYGTGSTAGVMAFSNGNTGTASNIALYAVGNQGAAVNGITGIGLQADNNSAGQATIRALNANSAPALYAQTSISTDTAIESKGTIFLSGAGNLATIAQKNLLTPTSIIKGWTVVSLDDGVPTIVSSCGYNIASVTRPSVGGTEYLVTFAGGGFVPEVGFSPRYAVIAHINPYGAAPGGPNARWVSIQSRLAGSFKFVMLTFDWQFSIVNNTVGLDLELAFCILGEQP